MSIKKQIGIYILGIIIVLSTTCFCISKILPCNYKNQISYYSKLYNLPFSLVCAVINTESHFNKNAISSAGAVGLMQLMPTTAEELAKNLKLDSLDLYNPTTNLHLGCYYLKTLIDKYKVVNTALCAYNAGPKNVDNWLNNPTFSTDQQNLIDIPFYETKNYIRKIGIFRTFYTIIYNP